jgi:hypothetical protein
MPARGFPNSAGFPPGRRAAGRWVGTVVGALWLSETAANGVARQVHPVAHPECVETVRAVALEGLVADHERSAISLLVCPSAICYHGHQEGDRIGSAGSTRLRYRGNRYGSARATGRVSDGTRTRDRLDHNQELYLLSYAHREALGM